MLQPFPERRIDQPLPDEFGKNDTRYGYWHGTWFYLLPDIRDTGFLPSRGDRAETLGARVYTDEESGFTGTEGEDEY